MTFGPFPAALTNAIQQGFLERAFEDSLKNVLVYREISDKEDFPGRIGDTITKTRVGLMVPNIAPLNPATNTNLDNGLTPQQYSDEQYTLTINQYPQVAPDINLIDDETTISAFAMKNSSNLGIAQATALDRLSRNAIFNAYMGGNTVLTTSASSVTQPIDDVRGFSSVVVNGSVVPVSSQNPLPIFVNNVANTVIAFTIDNVNVSSAYLTGGQSGTITLGTTISGTAGQTVIGLFAPVILRPNARSSTAAIQSTDLLTMQVIRAAVAQLRNNAVPTVRGSYNLHLNATSMNELYQDSEFQLLNRGVSTRDPVYENAWVYSMFLGVRFIETTETVVQPPQAGAPVPVAQTIQRPLLCGGGTLIEGMFTRGLDAVRNMVNSMGVGEGQPIPTSYNVLGEAFTKLGFYMYMRPPLDRLAQIISQTSNYVGGFTVPTDVTTNSTIIPTASNAYYKRAIIIETA